MRTIWYLLTLILSVIGTLTLIRFFERLAVGAELLPLRLLIALVALALAFVCLRQARAQSRSQQ